MLRGETSIQPVIAAPVPFEHLQGETDSRQVAWGVKSSFLRHECRKALPYIKASHLFTHKDFWVPHMHNGLCQRGHRLWRLIRFDPHTLMSREEIGQHKT